MGPVLWILPLGSSEVQSFLLPRALGLGQVPCLSLELLKLLPPNRDSSLTTVQFLAPPADRKLFKARLISHFLLKTLP